MSSYAKFFRRQLFLTPSRPSADLHGQVGLVTGSNVGLGFEAAKHFLELKVETVILAVRSTTKGDNARKELLKQYPQANILVWQVDMSSYPSIEAFVKRCGSLPRLDFAMLNAGVVKQSLEFDAVTGIEETIQVNYVATALLAILLLPILKSKQQQPGHPARLTIIGSEVADWAAFKERKEDPIFTGFKDPKYTDLNDRYMTSKLLEQHFVKTLAAKIPSDVVTINIANPGLCKDTALHREATSVTGAVVSGMKRAIGRTPEVGARPLVKATVEADQSSHGHYYSDNSVSPMAPLVLDKNGDKLGQQLWSELMQELAAYEPERIISAVAKATS